MRARPLLAAATLLAGACGSGEAVAASIEAAAACAEVVPAFTTQPSGRTVRFTNTSTGADRFEWQFGDGVRSTERDPTHTYGAAGTYTVVLVARRTTTQAAIGQLACETRLARAVTVG